MRGGKQKEFPAHWGEPPRVHTKDMRSWPGGYGMGSGTVGKWIAKKMEEDEKKAAFDSTLSDYISSTSSHDKARASQALDHKEGIIDKLADAHLRLGMKAEMKQHEANLHAAKESHSRRQAHSYAEKLRAKREKAKQARSSTSSLDPFAKDRERDIETFITMEATMQELERCFKILDTDSSGDLDQKEVEVFFDELHKQPLNVHTGSVDALRKTMADAVLKAGKLKYAKFVAVYCKALYTKR